MQLLRMPDSHPYHKIATRIDEEENEIIAHLWSRYLGVEDNPELAIRYLDIIRATFYGRMNFKNFDFQFLQGLLAESREVINKLSEQKSNSEQDVSY